MAERFDVIAVGIASHVVRLLATDKKKSQAEAVIDMAVRRRGVDTEFYTMAPLGAYRDGDRYYTS